MSTVLKGLLDDYKPSDLGFDNEQFPEYRDVQLEALEFAAYSDKRFVGLGCPTGSGKTLIAASLHKLTGLRTAILTSTRGLQQTYLDKHERDGLVDIRGRDNYECQDRGVIEAHGQVSCRKGSQLGCSECGLCDGSYLSARDRARDSELISTNYDWWMHANEHGRGAERSGEEAEEFGENPIQLLILDEADASISRLSNYLNVKVRENELEGEYESESIGESLIEWQKIAAEQLVQIDKQQRTLKMEIEYLLKAKRLKDVLEVSERIEKLDERSKKYKRISGMVEKEWVIEKHEHVRYGTSWSFDVVWPGRYAERHLFVGVEKVVLMSATLRPKHMRMLGIGADVSEFREWRRVFKPERGPILHLPPMKLNEKGEAVMINLNRGTSTQDLKVWVGLIDEIINEWAVKGEFKGLLHTVSYKRQEFLLERSEFSRLMIANSSDNPESPTAWAAYEKHCKSTKPCVLVSPSFSTGWDFPDDLCRFNIIGKVPFKDRTSKLMQARLKMDKQYDSQLTMDDLVQSAGRGNRSERDWCVTMIVDGALSFFMVRNKALAANWFGSAIRRVGEVPKARKLV